MSFFFVIVVVSDEEEKQPNIVHRFTFRTTQVSLLHEKCAAVTRKYINSPQSDAFKRKQARCLLSKLDFYSTRLELTIFHIAHNIKHLSAVFLTLHD